MKQVEDQIEGVLPDALKRDQQKKGWATKAGVATIVLFLASIVLYLSAVIIEPSANDT